MVEDDKKRSFVLFADSTSVISCLSDEQAGKIFKLIFTYVNGQDISKPEDLVVSAIFEMFRNQIDREHEKWIEKCRKNKENSYKRKCYVGTRPTVIARNQPLSTDNNCQQATSNVIINVNDNDNESVNKSDSDNNTNRKDTYAPLRPNNKERYSFDDIWNLYGKPVGDVRTLREKWKQLSVSDKIAIFDYVPSYVASRPEVKYRKNFENFLSLRVWENEPLTNNYYGNETSHQPDATRRQSAVQDAAGLMQEYLDGDKQPVA